MSTPRISLLSLVVLLSDGLLTSCANTAPRQSVAIAQCPQLQEPPPSLREPPQALHMTDRLPADLASALQTMPPSASTTPTKSPNGKDGTITSVNP